MNPWILPYVMIAVTIAEVALIVIMVREGLQMRRWLREFEAREAARAMRQPAPRPSLPPPPAPVKISAGRH